jgi:tetratricopeptide (TPR) repeat protein
LPALKGEDKEVINSFKKVINIDPGYAEAYYRIGLVYGKLQEGENAITKILIAEKFYRRQDDKEMVSHAGKNIRLFLNKYHLR